MQRILCSILFATAWGTDLFAAKNFGSTTPEEDALILLFLIVGLLLPSVLMCLGYWYSLRWLKIISAVLTTPLLTIALFAIYYGIPLGVIPLLFSALNLYLLSNRREKQTVDRPE